MPTKEPIRAPKGLLPIEEGAFSRQVILMSGGKLDQTEKGSLLREEVFYDPLFVSISSLRDQIERIALAVSRNERRVEPLNALDVMIRGKEISCAELAAINNIEIEDALLELDSLVDLGIAESYSSDTGQVLYRRARSFAVL